MKKNSLFIMIVCFIWLQACETDTSIDIGPRNSITPVFASNVFPAIFDVNNLEKTFVALNFDKDVKLDGEELKFQVSYQKENNRATLATFSTLPAAIEFKLTDVVAVLGMELSKVKPGDNFLVETLIKKGGVYYRSKANYNFSAVCAYDADFVTGTYNVESKSWGSSGIVTLTADENDPYTINVVGLAAMDNFVEDKGPLKFVVNPNNFEVTCPKAILSTKVMNKYDNYAYEGAYPGKLNTCNGTYNMSFAITVDQGSFGEFTDFVFTKK